MSVLRPNPFDFDSPYAPHDKSKECLFDFLTISITALDICTDVYITYTFWSHSQLTYFYISLAILLTVHLSYCVLFVHLFKVHQCYTLIQTVLITLFILLPLSPFLSIVFYLTATDDSKLSKYLHRITRLSQHKDSNDDTIQDRKMQINATDPTKRWISNNTRKHIGFIFESFLQSFPQFLLQLFVILLQFNAKTTASISFASYFSIFLSLLSLSMSSYIFCHSIYFKLFVFNYLCVIADFIKLFTCIVWTFNPPFHYENIHMLYVNNFFFYVWICKLLCITSIAALYLSIQFVWNRIDCNYNLYSMTTNFGRRRSISRSHSKSKSKSNTSNKSVSSHYSSKNSSKNSSKPHHHSNHLSTYHVSHHSKTKSARRHRSKLWKLIKNQMCIKNGVLSEIVFVILFVLLVLCVWPFTLLLLDIASFSLIAFMIDKFNTSRFLSIHWNLWKYVFNFLLNPYSPFNFYNTYYYDTSTASNYYNNNINWSTKRYRNNSQSTVRSRSSRNSSFNTHTTSRSSRSSNNNTTTTTTPNEPSSNPPTMIHINALSPTDSANEANEAPPPITHTHEDVVVDISYGEIMGRAAAESEDHGHIESIIESSKSQNSLPDIMDGNNKTNHLDAAELQVKLNTLANSGYKAKNSKKRTKRNKARARKGSGSGGINAYALRKKKKKEFEKQIQTKFDIPWSTEKDSLIRLCTVNYILAQNRECRKLYKFLERSLQSNFFNNVTYNELRYYSSGGVKFYDFIFTYHHEYIVEKWRALSEHVKKSANAACFYQYQKFELVLKWFGLFIVLPLYVLSQLLFVLFPYVLFVYHNIDSLKFDSLKILQYVLMALYSVFVVLLICMFPVIFKFTRITCYIHYNCILYFSSYHYASRDYIEKKMIQDIKKLYQNLVATQLRANLLHKIFGNDVSELILSYLPSFHIVMDENQLLMENNDDNQLVTQLNDFDENWQKFMLYNNHIRNIDVDDAKSNADEDDERDNDADDDDEEEKYCMDMDPELEEEHTTKKHRHRDRDNEDDEALENMQMQICVTPAIHPQQLSQQQTLEEELEEQFTIQLQTPSMHVQMNELNLNPLLISNVSDVSNADRDHDAESNLSSDHDHDNNGNNTDHSNLSLTPQ